MVNKGKTKSSKNQGKEGFASTDTPATTDEFKIGSHIKGLSDFLMTCSTPLTISIKGDWGTGKTSIMRQVKQYIENENNKEGNKAKILNIWFDTWQFSQFSYDNQLPIILLSRLVSEITDKIPGSKNKHGRALSNTVKNISNLIGGSGADIIKHRFGFDLSRFTSNKKVDTFEQIEDIKINFGNLVEEFTREASDYDRIVIFIDDLDRLAPKRAIELLETLKLFLDVENCVFVLAIDYDIVIRGASDKYGFDMNDPKEAEKGKDFFDKIIQISYTVPKGEYNFDSLLKKFSNKKDTEEETRTGKDKKAKELVEAQKDAKETLHNYVYSDDNKVNTGKLKNEDKLKEGISSGKSLIGEATTRKEVVQTLADAKEVIDIIMNEEVSINLEDLEVLLRTSVGENPRSIKRILNTFQLNRLIKPFNSNESLVLIGFICMEQAYTPIHSRFIQELRANNEKTKKTEDMMGKIIEEMQSKKSKGTSSSVLSAELGKPEIEEFLEKLLEVSNGTNKESLEKIINASISTSDQITEGIKGSRWNVCDNLDELLKIHGDKNNKTENDMETMKNQATKILNAIESVFESLNEELNEEYKSSRKTNRSTISLKRGKSTLIADIQLQKNTISIELPLGISLSEHEEIQRFTKDNKLNIPANKRLSLNIDDFKLLENDGKMKDFLNVIHIIVKNK